MEELNQVQEENLFSDSIEEIENEESVENNEETTEETNVPMEENTPEEPKPFLHVKYNGQEKDLNEDEARTLAQKGMNYDRFYEPLQKLAKMNGLEVGDFLTKLNQVQNETEVNNELEALKTKYPDANLEILNELAQKRVNERFDFQTKKMEEERKSADDALNAEAERQVKIFKKEYPNIDPNNLDAQVYEYVKDGYSLLESYNKWSKIQDEKNKPLAEAQKLNESNKKKSLGNTSNAGEQEVDPFFEGFDSI